MAGWYRTPPQENVESRFKVEYSPAAKQRDRKIWKESVNPLKIEEILRVIKASKNKLTTQHDLRDFEVLGVVDSGECTARAMGTAIS